MGGMGSGGWMRLGSKSTVDSQHAVDIRYLKKQGLIWAGNNGTLTWSCRGEKTGAINYQVKESGIKLIYNSRAANTEEWEAVEQFVSFDYTPCHYGGKRTWLLCTECNRRVTCIYVTGKYFLCRHCCGLNHQSQHEGYYDRQLSKAQGIRTKLGGSASLAIPFPEKPKGMHWKTYRKLYMQSMRSEGEHLQHLDKYFNRLSSRFS
ncbi:MAG: hypothetical protein QM500_09240 [Methylococcales bacterium]